MSITTTGYYLQVANPSIDRIKGIFCCALIMIADSGSIPLYSSGIVFSAFEPSSELGKRDLLTAAIKHVCILSLWYCALHSSLSRLQLEFIGHPTEYKELGKCSAWTYQVDWMHAKNISLALLPNKSAGYYGKLYYQHFFWLFVDSLTWAEWTGFAVHGL